MKLEDKQALFARKISVLMQVATELGYGVKVGEFYQDALSNAWNDEALHKLRLAAHLDLFKDGKSVTNGVGHNELHVIWVMMGGAPSEGNATNHYSLEHNGQR